MPQQFQQEIKASIIIRTFNEEKHIGRLLAELAQQKTRFRYEIIVVDSGSRDNTISIIEKFNDISLQLLEIDPEDFTFGRSLNKGVEAANGAYGVMISAHCHPTDDRWLESMLKPFDEDEKVALVFGRQQGNHLTKFSEHQIFTKLYPATSNYDCTLPFANNANAAIRRSVWLEHRFDEKLTGLEDLEWAKTIKSKGHRIAYQAQACVHHIHEESSRQVYRRYFREALAYREIYKQESFSIFDFFKFFLLNLAGDLFHAVSEQKLMGNVAEITRFRFWQFWGTYHGSNHHTPVLRDLRSKLYYPRNPEIFRLSRRTPQKEAQQNDLEILDITRPLSASLPVWPGAKSFDRQQVKHFDDHNVNESHLSFNIHTGTHIDVPYHFIKDGDRVGDISLQKMMGDSLVMEYMKQGPIDAGFFEGASVPIGTSRILLKTLNSFGGTSDGFDKNFVALTPCAATWLAGRNIDLIGVDGPSVQCFHDGDNQTHVTLLEAGVVILEGLNLKAIEPGRYNLIALPLNIPDAEGAPARAVLTRNRLP